MDTPEMIIKKAELFDELMKEAGMYSRAKDAAAGRFGKAKKAIKKYTGAGSFLDTVAGGGQRRAQKAADGVRKGRLKNLLNKEVDSARKAKNMARLKAAGGVAALGAAGYGAKKVKDNMDKKAALIEYLRSN